jgi:signal transduction histidine kinase
MEPLDQFEKKAPYTYIVDQQKEERSNIFNAFILIASLIVVGIAFVKSWPSSNEVEISHINERRLELLDQLQNTTEETERNQIATEYNRLTNQVEQLQENEED